MEREGPFRPFPYRLEIGSIPLAGFSEVSLGELPTGAVDYREGNERTTVRKLPGLPKHGNVTLRRGITDSTELAEWHRRAVEGANPRDEARRTVILRVRDEAGEEIAAFEIVDAWPCKYSATDSNATGNEVAIEILELCHEGVRRIA